MRRAIRRGGLLGALCAAVVLTSVRAAPAGAGAASSDARIRLQAQLDTLARGALPGVLGIAILDLRSGTEWQVNGRRAFPMMSVFKVPLAATVLAQIDRGELTLDRTITLRRSDLRGGRSAIAARFHGERMVLTVRQLLRASVSESDNTAADALLRVAGGPTAVTAFLRAHRIRGIRVDRGEGAIAREFAALGEAREPPAAETPARRLERLRRGYAAYLADPRDRASPQAAARLLRALWRGELLSSSSTHLLLELMSAQTSPARLRAGLPAGVRLADKCGTSYEVEGHSAAYNDIGILSRPKGSAVIVAGFLMGSPASESESEQLFKNVAATAAELLRR